jgi:ribonuclease P protein component
MKKEGFPREIRIKKKYEFDEILKKGKKISGENLTLYRLDTNQGKQKFGIKLNKKIKGAVKRNRIKRLLREILRKNKNKFRESEKVLVFYRSDTVKVSYRDLLSEFENLAG